MQTGFLPTGFVRLFFMGIAAGYLLQLLHYYATGSGGPTQLAVLMVPASIVILIWNDLRLNAYYPSLPANVQQIIALMCTTFATAATVYLHINFEALRMDRLGDWNTADHIAAGVLILLVLENTRRYYLPVFIFNLVLILYCVYGYLLPGMFGHPGLSWTRVSSAAGLEMSTGIFERLPQLGLTLIGSFMLLLACLKAFGCIDAILKSSTRISRKSPALLPQGAIVGSFGVAAVSGSGAANAAATGSVTIPMLIRSGFPRAHAAAVETAASLGGQLMPPLMGISAFLMADLMGVRYFEVVEKAFGPAIIYFLGVALAVYLMSRRYLQSDVISTPESEVNWYDTARVATYLITILALVWLMGVERLPGMMAAQRVFYFLLAGLTILHLLEFSSGQRKTGGPWYQPFLTLISQFAVTTSQLTILLASLGILTAAFSITGVPDKLGTLLMQLADFHLVAIILTAFAIGYLVGMGLPVAPTYIILAVVTAPFLIRAGVDPWTAHFFAFFIAVFGELSPPTSVTAAVTSRIAETSFLRTMFHSVNICIPLLILMAAIFLQPQILLGSGVERWMATGQVLLASLGLVFALHGRVGLAGKTAATAARVAIATLSAAVLCW